MRFMNRTTVHRLCRLLLLLALTLVAGPARATQVSLSWEPAASGLSYRVHHGAQSRCYSAVADAGARTSATVYDLVPGQAYYFAVSAYSAGNESGFSNEVRYFPPVVPGDADGDGLSDTKEAAYGTDSERFDSNGDGVSDAEALAFWGAAWNEDNDRDGIVNLLDPTPGAGGPAPAVSPYAGWWFDPEAPGSGVSLDVKDQLLYLAWYVYDDAGAPVWYVSLAAWNQASGRFEGELLTSTGAPPGTEGGHYLATAAGSVAVSFSAYDGLVFSYQLGTAEGALRLARLMPHLAPGSADPRNLTGWWWDKTHPGSGFFLEAYGETVYLVWYHYDQAGSPRWWGLGGGTDVGGFPEGSTSYDASLMEFSGGQTVGGAWQPPDQAWLDPATLVFLSGDTARFTALGHDYDLTRFDFAGLSSP